MCSSSGLLGLLPSSGNPGCGHGLRLLDLSAFQPKELLTQDLELLSLPGNPAFSHPHRPLLLSLLLILMPASRFHIDPIPPNLQPGRVLLKLSVDPNLTFELMLHSATLFSLSWVKLLQAPLAILPGLEAVSTERGMGRTLKALFLLPLIPQSWALPAEARSIVLPRTGKGAVSSGRCSSDTSLGACWSVELNRNGGLACREKAPGSESPSKGARVLLCKATF